MNITDKCLKYINIGIVIRLVVTVITFNTLYIYSNLHILTKNIYLILPIILLVLDKLDNILICTKTFYYQLNDKIVDLLSYLLVFTLIPINNILLLLIIYRLIGVILFGITGLSIYLVIFFDFIKEYLLYIYLFKNNNSYIYLFIVGKILIEYIHHNYLNKNSY